MFRLRPLKPKNSFAAVAQLLAQGLSDGSTWSQRDVHNMGREFQRSLGTSQDTNTEEFQRSAGTWEDTFSEKLRRLGDKLEDISRRARGGAGGPHEPASEPKDKDSGLGSAEESVKEN